MLTKNLITFKRWENPILGVVGGGRGGSRKTNIKGELPKKAIWAVCRYSRGLGKKSAMYF